MENNNLNIFTKGNFEIINTGFTTDGLKAMSAITAVQKQYKKRDIDTLFNELHDSIVGDYLGFTHANTKKHGFDCKYEKNGHTIFLESKVATWNPKGIRATFNDTNLEKAQAFKDEKVWLALSVWESASEILFICFGQNEKIGEFLERRVKEQIKSSRRRTQNISLSQLIMTYGFSILTITKTPEEIYTLLTLSNKNFRKMDRNCIIDLKNYIPITEKIIA